MRRIRSALIYAILGGALLACTSVEEPRPSADLILHNGAIFTGNPDQPWAEAVAISDGRYLVVGTNDDVADYRKGAEVIDLDGQMAMSGIFDAHVHPLMAGTQALFECVFGFDADPQTVADTVRECSERAPEDAWIIGGQWSSSFFDLYSVESPREWLDEASGGRPVVLVDDSRHNAWVSSAALGKAGIAADTPDPEGGTIVRDSSGQANGVLLETAARLMDEVVPAWSTQQLAEAAEYSMRLATEFGISGVKDAGAFTSDAARAYGLLDAAGKLTLHVATCLATPYGHREEPLDYDAIVALREELSSENVHTNFVKLFMDGVPTVARTAAMIQPYVADDAHGDNYTGHTHIAPDLLAADVTALDQRGFTIKIHTAGDRSVQIALDAIEAARTANGDSGLMHELAHAGYVDATDIKRFAQLGAVADFSPYLWHPSPIIQSVLNAVGPERGPRYWPTRDLLDAGAAIAAGSDWPAAVPEINPWIGIEALVTRRDPRGQSPGALWPEQAVSLEEALTIYTLNGARAFRLDAVTGSVEQGKFADLIVLDRNLFEVPAEQISDARPTQVYFKGEVVLQK